MQISQMILDVRKSFPQAKIQFFYLVRNDNFYLPDTEEKFEVMFYDVTKEENWK